MRSLLALLLVATPLLAGSSNSLLDVEPNGKRLAVANTDSGTVSIVDLKTRKKLAEFPVGDHPEGVAWAGSTNTLLVTVWGDDRVHFYDADKGHQFGLKVDDEPYGIVTTKDGKLAYLSHDYPGTISEIDIAARKVTRSFKVGKFVRGLAISSDEKTLYATEFFTTNLIAVNRESGKITETWPGYESDNLARHVALHPTRPKAYLSHLRSRVNVFDARGSIFPQISICDLFDKPKDEKKRRSITLDTYNRLYVMANPWESAVSPDGKRIYKIYAGTNDMNISELIDDDFSEMTRIGNAIKVGQNPRAVRIHPNGKEIYLYNTLDFEVCIYDADMKKLDSVKVTEPPHSAEWRRGKELFQTALPPMGGGRNVSWVSCSSCHPDGVTDGRTWQNPEGDRKTPNMFALAHTHPLHWSADRDETQDFEYTIRGVLMRGRGLCNDRLKPAKGFEPVALDQKTSGLSKDLDAMALYTNSFPVRPSPHAPDGKLSESAERGKKLFFNAEVNCASCHSGPYYTDSTLKKPFKLHDVGTGGGEREKMGPKYDTPTLLGVYRMPTFLHDGRAKSLEDVFTKFNPKDQHGKTSHLAKADLGDLIEFVKALPYETPPSETSNTVKDYLKDMVYPRPPEKK